MTNTTVTESSHLARILKTSAETERRFVLSAVYVPGEMDDQGHYAEADEIELACWQFMINLAAGKADAYLQHDGETVVGQVVESYIERNDVTIGNQFIPAGTWMVGIILAPAYWQMVKDGTLTGFSMGGEAYVED